MLRECKKSYIEREHNTQKAFFKWLTLRHPFYRRLTFAIPNGGKRDLITATRLKEVGVTAGVPDVFFSLPNDTYHGLYIEFKDGRNKLTKPQAQMKLVLENAGYRHEICYDWEEAKKAFERYVNGRESYFTN